MHFPADFCRMVVMDTIPFLEARGICRSYGRTTALENVSFYLERGRNTLILGPNGAGKSTLGRILALLSKPSSGSLFWEGGPVEGASRRTYRRRLGYLSHQLFLYSHLSAGENLEFFAALYGIPRPAEKAAEMLERFDLSVHRSRLAGELSRGMQQRLSIARLLLSDPELLILDEPFTGLDAESSETLRSFLLSLRPSKKAVLLITHDILEAEKISDSLIILDKGRVRFSGDIPDAGKLGDLYLERTGGEPQ